MSKPKKFGVYICLNGKNDSLAKLPYNVTGRYCKNNCEHYMNGCKKFKGGKK